MAGFSWRAVSRRVACAFPVAGTCALLALGAAASASQPAKCDTVATCVFAENDGRGNGMEGRSTLGTGVTGRTSSPSTSVQTARAGVAGYDSSASTFNYGVLGTSRYGNGGAGLSAFGTGLYGSSNAGTGVFAESNQGTALVVNSNASYEPAVVVSAADSVAVSADAYGPNSDGAYISAGNVNPGSSATGLIVSLYGGGGTAIASSLLAGPGGPKIDHYDAYTNGNGVASISRSGNMSLAGTLRHHGTELAEARGADGASAIAYGDRTTLPELDDMGEAQLVDGHAYVPLERTFASLIRPSANYLVFITPRGDNRGLYVTTVTHHGFAVRESNGGHATLAFDYRIVAEPYDTKSQRLPASDSVPALTRAAKLPARRLRISH